MKDWIKGKRPRLDYTWLQFAPFWIVVGITASLIWFVIDHIGE